MSTAAAHANDAMMRIEKFKKLLEVQVRIRSTFSTYNQYWIQCKSEFSKNLLREGFFVIFSATLSDFHCICPLAGVSGRDGGPGVSDEGASQGGEDGQDLGEERRPPGQIHLPGECI